MPDQHSPVPAPPSEEQRHDLSAADDRPPPAEPEPHGIRQSPPVAPGAADGLQQHHSDFPGGTRRRTDGAVRPADVAQVLSLIVAPTTLVTALLYYFGWASTQAYSKNFGLEQSLLGLSTTDYLVRSVAPMFWPLTLLVLVSTVAFLLHLALMRVLPQSAAVAQRWVPVAIGLIGILFLWQGMPVFLGSGLPVPFKVPRVIAEYGFTPPQVFLAGGVALVSYAGYLWDRLGVSVEQRQPWVETSSWAARGLVVLPMMLIVLLIFWAVAGFAVDYGVTRAKALESTLDELASVTVYSANRLYIDSDGSSASRVQENALPDADGAYRYRYQGLRLLMRSNDRYFLLPESWSPQRPVTIVLRDTETIRVELRRGTER
jgi:hypothetical protein